MININELVNDSDFYQFIETNGKKIKAVVQYLSNDEMQRLPEGERYKEHIRIDTDCELSLQDSVFYKGNEYRVVYEQDWGSYGYKNYTAIRFDGLENPNSNGFELT